MLRDPRDVHANGIGDLCETGLLVRGHRNGAFWTGASRSIKRTYISELLGANQLCLLTPKQDWRNPMDNALLTAWRLLEHGWPQKSVVHILRQVRQDLARDISQILASDPSALFDEAAIRQNARAGDIYTGSTDESFLVVVSKKGLE